MQVRRPIILAFVVAASLGGWLYVSLYVPVGGGRQALRFTVSKGAPARVVATQLRAKGLIRSAWTFTAAAAWRGGWRQARAGDYAFRRDMSALDILHAIERGAVISEWITVPEGATLWQIAALVEADGLGRGEDFLRAAHSPRAFNAGFPLPGDSLEGYLFPDTYRVARHPGAVQDLVKMMLARFDEVIWRGLLGGRSPHSSLHELVTLASLVEGEAKLDAERPIIAAVLTNRLQQGMKLECDATVQYALGRYRKARLSYEDLKIESPYNTYLHAGLPPGPINNPGRASIEAALHPAAGRYLFYVARPDGSHVFSSTYAEHLRAIARVRAAAKTVAGR
jgi:UPF0755 protein